MPEAKATPGPWLAHSDDNGRESTEIRAAGSLIANVYGSEDFPCLTDEDTDATAQEMLANARLIAAAPDLLAALKACLVAAGYGYDPSEEAKDPNMRRIGDAIEMGHAAIRKAEGRDA